MEHLISVSHSNVRVSSVLNKNVKEFGKKYLFDEKEETCWNSDQGSPQFIKLKFDDAISPSSLHIQFQGGFAGKECYVCNEDSESEKVYFYPSDNSSLQKFELMFKTPVQSLKITFVNSTDFFGRIVVYNLRLYSNP